MSIFSFSKQPDNNSDPKPDAIPKQYIPLLWLVAFALFMQTLDGSGFATAIPAMAKTFNADPLQMQTVVITASLVSAMVVPASGWLSDHFGTKKIFLAALLCYTIGAFISGSANSLGMLIAARMVQGIGGALLIPVGRLVVLKALPRSLFLPAMSTIMMPALIGPLIGPALGGYISEYYSWRWMFFLNIPLGIIGMLLTLQIMPNITGEKDKFDWLGFIYLSLSMLCLSLGLDGLSKTGTQHSTVLILLISGLIFLATYALHASRLGKHALYDPALFKINSFRVGVLGNIFSRIGSGGMPFLLILLYQVAFKAPPTKAGLMMVFTVVGALIGKQMVTSLIDRWGYRTTLVINTLLLSISICTFVFLTGQNLIVDGVIIALFGLFNSMQFTCMGSVSLKDLDNQQASSGNSLLSMITMISMGMSVAVGSAIMAGFNHYLGSGSGATLESFKATFISIGIITGMSAWIYTQLQTTPVEKKELTDNAVASAVSHS